MDFDEAAKVLTVLIDFAPGSRFAVSGHEGVHPVAGDTLAALESELLARLRDRLRIRPVFAWLAPGTLPREAGKTRHIEIEG